MWGSLLEWGENVAVFNDDCIPVGVGEDGQELPIVDLFPNYPNPFNPATTIGYDVPVAQQTWLTIYSVDGRRIATLVDGLSIAGSHEVIWAGTDELGRQVPSGIYFYCLEAGEYAETKRMVLIR